MNAEHELLASAYLDGELTDDERRIAEADPAVMAEVTELNALRARLADATPPSTATREAAIAAAMGEFRQIYATADSGVAETVAAGSVAAEIPRHQRSIPFRPRPLYARWLGVAAAVLVVGLLGLVITAGFQGIGGGDDSADVATDAALDEPAAESGSDDLGSTVERLPDAQIAIDEADTPGDEADAEQAMESASEPAADTPDEPVDDGASVVVDPSLFFSLAGQPTLGQPIVPIASSDQLTAAADYLLGLAEAGDLPSTPETACPYPVFADSSLLLGSDDVETPIHVAVLPDDDRVLAIDVDTCEIVLEAPIGR